MKDKIFGVLSLMVSLSLVIWLIVDAMNLGGQLPIGEAFAGFYIVGSLTVVPITAIRLLKRK